MGSMLSAIDDDKDEYKYLCEKHNQEHEEVYSYHHLWLTQLDARKTELSFVAWKKEAEIKRLKLDIEALKMKIQLKENQLKKLE